MTNQQLAFIDNGRLDPRVNWTTLGEPMRAAFADLGATVISPGPFGADWRGVVRQARASKQMFWMQLSSRPEPPLLAAALAGGLARRSAYVIDAWPYAQRKIALFATALRLRPCFVAFREAFEDLAKTRDGDRFVHLPFGVDLDVFAPRAVERDIFAFSMGRRHEPLHRALADYCEPRGLTYLSSTGGAIKDPHKLGELVSRARYFVVTPPDLDHPERSGGYSPLVMRYLEGLAGGARLLGVLPGSGEFERMFPIESILTVAPDGSDLAARLAADARDDSGFAATRSACAIIRARHGWIHRARDVVEQLRGTG